jgi:hypothetical protein
VANTIIYERDPMIGNCFNPACNEELRYLRQGSVYQLETGVGREFHSEFFWLCPVCSTTFKVGSDHKGAPLLSSNSSSEECHQKCCRVRRVLRGVLEDSSVLPNARSAEFTCAS